MIEMEVQKRFKVEFSLKLAESEDAHLNDIEKIEDLKV